ncbi:MAG: DNA repair protein RecO [Phycisphaerales bacterium]|nr:DNA repair protein RecO [Phycisphaerales bacterium]
MPALTDEALCIRHWEWSETSQTAALFTRLHGVVRVLAKGSRRPKAPYSGGLELLTRAEIGFIPKANSELALLVSWDLRQSFPALRRSLSIHNTGLYIADLLFNFVRDHDPHTDLYDATLAALEAMTSPRDGPGELLRFQWALLEQCGFKPQLEVDVRTGEALPDLPAALFSPSLGGVLAAGNRQTESESPAIGDAWRVRLETIRLLRGIALGRELAPTVQPAAATIDRGNRLLASYIRHILGFEPPTMPVLFGGRLAP